MIRQDVPGMPHDLVDAVYDLDEGDREIALENWLRIGPAGRRLLTAYLDAVYFRWSRRGRCKLAALQLLTPDRPMFMGDASQQTGG